MLQQQHLSVAHTAIEQARAPHPIPNCEVKCRLAKLVLRWGITRESFVSYVFFFIFPQQNFVFNITTYTFSLHITAFCSYNKHHRNTYFPAYILSFCINPAPISKYSHSTHLCHIIAPLSIFHLPNSHKCSPESPNPLIPNESLLKLSTVHSHRSPTAVSIYLSICIYTDIYIDTYIHTYIHASWNAIYRHIDI